MDAVVKNQSAAQHKPPQDNQDNKDASGAGKPSEEAALAAVRTLIAYIGDDPDREGLKDTPKRVLKAYREFFSGYHEDAQEALARRFKDVKGYKDIVLLRDIDISSHCEHHMVPFIGRAHIAYYPGDQVVGISKLTRVVEIFAKRLQTQETMTVQVADAIETALQPRGVAVLIDAVHHCMTMRGIRKPNVSTITTQFTGVFKDSEHEQQRFLNLIRGG